ALQPVDVAAQPAQALGILHVDPEVPTPFGEVHDIKRRDHNGSHDDLPSARTNSLATVILHGGKVGCRAPSHSSRDARSWNAHSAGLPHRAGPGQMAQSASGAHGAV